MLLLERATSNIESGKKEKKRKWEKKNDVIV